MAHARRPFDGYNPPGPPRATSHSGGVQIDHTDGGPSLWLPGDVARAVADEVNSCRSSAVPSTRARELVRACVRGLGIPPGVFRLLVSAEVDELELKEMERRSGRGDAAALDRLTLQLAAELPAALEAEGLHFRPTPALDRLFRTAQTFRELNAVGRVMREAEAVAGFLGIDLDRADDEPEQVENPDPAPLVVLTGPESR